MSDYPSDAMALVADDIQSVLDTVRMPEMQEARLRLAVDALRRWARANPAPQDDPPRATWASSGAEFNALDEDAVIRRADEILARRGVGVLLGVWNDEPPPSPVPQEPPTCDVCGGGDAADECHACEPTEAPKPTSGDKPPMPLYFPNPKIPAPRLSPEPRNPSPWPPKGGETP